MKKAKGSITIPRNKYIRLSIQSLISIIKTHSSSTYAKELCNEANLKGYYRRQGFFPSYGWYHSMNNHVVMQFWLK
jgi:hypothetical protein